MKFALEFDVESTIRLGREIDLEKIVVSTKEGREYSFLAGQDGTLKSIRITVKVDPEKFSSTIGPGVGASKAHVRVNADSAVVDELRADFQAIESVFSFLTGALRRVVWNKETTRYIPETEAEKASTSIASFGATVEYPEKWVNLDFVSALRLLAAKDRYVSLKVPMAWYREGRNHYDGLKYVDAFNDFYFVLEDLYCDGKTGKTEVLRRLKASAELGETVEWEVEQVKHYQRHLAGLQAMQRVEMLHLDTEGLIELIVETRGKTHHYSAKAGGRYPDPFRQAPYESIAWVMLGIATRVIGRRAAVLDNCQS